MKLVLSEPKLLKDSINILSDLVSEAKIRLDRDKLEIIAMDPANVAMVVFKLLNSAFSEYEVQDEEYFSVNLDNLKQILGRAKPSDSIIMNLDDEKNRLNIKIVGESIRNFNLGLIDISDSEQKVPELEFLARIEMNTPMFNEAVEDMDIIADSVGLMIKDDKFVVSAEGTTSDAKVEINKTDETVINFDKDLIKSKYSAEYLKKIIKGSKLVDKVSIKFSQDYPVQIEYSIKDKLQLTTILAPRVER